MTKKIFLGMSAITMLFATSCQNELDIPTITNEEVAVSFQISTPEISTRYSDGTTAQVLKYAVYDAEGTRLSIGGETSIAKTANVRLDLTTGNTYNVIFWADAAGSPYTIDFDAKTMSVDYAADKTFCNDESRDAFYAKHTFTVTGAQTETVELRRPFAQLNIGAADYAKSESAGYKPTKSSVTVKNVYTVLGLWEGDVAGEQMVTFAEADIDRTQTFPVDGNEYIAMNYLLVGKDSETVDVEFTYTDGETSKSRTVGAVPVQRNYRTNIYGDILTSNVDVNVEIKPGYNEPDIVANLQYICSNGGTATLTEDVTLIRPLVVKAGVKVVLDLNGKSIINTTESEEFGEGEGIIAYGDLTINGTGTVQGSTMAVWARGNDGAKVTINGGTYNGCKEGFAKGGRSVIYASSGNTIDIYGGEFQALTADKTSYANKTDGVFAALNVADNNGMIKVYGGRFFKQNPATPGTEPKAWNDANPNGFVAEGYNSTADGDWFVVAEAPAVAEVANADELKDALENVSTNVISISQNINISDSSEPWLDIDHEVKIVTGENTLTVGNAANYGLFCNASSDVTFENAKVMFKGGGIVAREGTQVAIKSGSYEINSTQTSARYLIYAQNEGSVVTINGGEFSFETSKKRAYIYTTTGATVYVKGGTFGKASTQSSYKTGIMGTGTVIITGGTFGFDPSAWVADGYEATENGTVWTVAKK